MNDTVIILCAFSFVYRAQVWADSVGVLYSGQTIQHLSWKVVCSHHFSEADVLHHLNVYTWTEW
jgi:ABC-type antimicrobial peptide transport system ATPase subunit